MAWGQEGAKRANEIWQHGRFVSYEFCFMRVSGVQGRFGLLRDGFGLVLQEGRLHSAGIDCFFSP